MIILCSLVTSHISTLPFPSLPIQRCCNNCTALRDAYEYKGWSFTDSLKESEQCIRDVAFPFANVDKDEGCRINGYMNVNKVAGNFHIAHGESIVRDGRHIHQFVPAEAHTFNISHTLHSISFGAPYPNMPPNPLDNGTNNILNLDHIFHRFQYLQNSLFNSI